MLTGKTFLAYRHSCRSTTMPEEPKFFRVFRVFRGRMKTMPNLFLLFSHTLTNEQKADARQTLKVQDFISLPEDLQAHWSDVPPDRERIDEYVQPVFTWLLDQTNPGDHVLVQGDFGAVCLAVVFARKHGLIPVYSTTKRETEEVRLPDGTVKKQSTFRHVRYRRYQT